MTSPSIFKGKLRDKLRLTNNLIKRYSVFTHGLLEKQVFSFPLYYFSFYLSFRLFRKLVFLYFNVNVYLMEIPCLNKVTLPYLTSVTSPGMKMLTTRLKSKESTVDVIIIAFNARPDNFRPKFFLRSSNILLSQILYMGIKNLQRRIGTSRDIHF